MTFSIMTFNMKGLFVTLSINDNQYNAIAFSIMTFCIKGLFVTMSIKEKLA
jgi:hypothetical protein